MGKPAAPRRKYRPRPVATNPIALAVRRARKIPEQEIEAVMIPVKASFKALREGIANEHQWRILAGTVEMALAIEREGVVRGLHGHLQEAEAALAAIRLRAMATGEWRSTALYFQEIAALDEFTWLHKAQLEHLSEGEWNKAYDRALANVMSSGGMAVHVDQARQEQLQLLGAAA